MTDRLHGAPASLSSDDPVLPEGFAEAITRIRAALAACLRDGIPHETILAALMAELMPMLSAAYGPRGVSAVLGKVATAMNDIAAAQEQRH